MAKIINVGVDIVEIGDNGELIEVHRSDLSFTPHLGDQVEIYRSAHAQRVVLAEKSTTSAQRVVLVEKSTTPTKGADISKADVLYGSAAFGKPVKKYLYCFCALFFGGLGLHKFAANKIKTGLIYLLLSWTLIPAIAGFIEGLIGLFKRADENGIIYV
jgi:TM2 domain-containing membrane protein YozV